VDNSPAGSGSPSAPSQAANGDYARLTARRLQACEELLATVAAELGMVIPSQQAPWVLQRQTELILRAIQAMHGSVLLAKAQLWIPTYALSRVLLEGAAVAHWLAVHPEAAALEARWQEHLDAVRSGDFKTQQSLGLDIDVQTIEWQRAQDRAYLEHIGNRHRDGANHWTGKSVIELLAGAAAQGAPDREDWDGRTRLLSRATKRALPLANLGLHHSPAASQNWYAPPDELLPEALRFAWLAFALHATLAVEDLAPQQLGDLRALIDRQGQTFSTEPSPDQTAAE
jgi:hypothetical protein